MEGDVAMLKQKTDDMAKAIDEIKADIKDMKNDIVDLRLTFAKYIGIAVGAFTVIQLLISHYIK